MPDRGGELAAGIVRPISCALVWCVGWTPGPGAPALGKPLHDAVESGKQYVTEAMRHGLARVTKRAGGMRCRPYN